MTTQRCPWWVDYERGIECTLPINHTGPCLPHPNETPDEPLEPAEPVM